MANQGYVGSVVEWNKDKILQKQCLDGHTIKLCDDCVVVLFLRSHCPVFVSSANSSE